MTPFLQLVFAIAVILFAAKLAGYLSLRLGQPSVLGELLVGILLGPSLLNLLHLPILSNTALGETVTQLGKIGVMLLMFLAGLELHLDELRRNTKVSALASAFGLVLSVGLGWGTARLFGIGDQAALFLGLALGATSVSISAQTLLELKVLRSRVGLGLLGAAVLDDVMALLAFSAFLAFTSGNGDLPGLLWIFLKVLIFLGAAMAFGLWLLPRLARIVARLPISQSALTLAIVTLFAYGLAAELVGGMAAIIGAFIAGLMFARTPEKSLVDQGMNALAYGLFVPIFFVNIGLAVNLHALDIRALWMILAFATIAIAGKMLGAGGGARLAGFTGRESLQLGGGMAARGEVSLIIASVGLGAGLISVEALSALVGTVLVTILVTPPVLRALFHSPIRSKAAKPAEEAQEIS
jgi:Kef-type K+ transport system membrane component KefB